MSIKLLKPRELPGFCQASHFKESTQRPLLIVWPQTQPLDSEWEHLKSAPSVGNHTTENQQPLTPSPLQCWKDVPSAGVTVGSRLLASTALALLGHQSKNLISDHPWGMDLSTPCHIYPGSNVCHQPTLKIMMALAALCLWLYDRHNNNRNNKSLLS